VIGQHLGGDLGHRQQAEGLTRAAHFHGIGLGEAQAQSFRAVRDAHAFGLTGHDQGVIGVLIDHTLGPRLDVAEVEQHAVMADGTIQFQVQMLADAVQAAGIAPHRGIHRGEGPDEQGLGSHCGHQSIPLIL
tara:strand:+ start:1243 stop:1638 length:396 start_codon:yes stop_codon:yes gene_type:complete